MNLRLAPLASIAALALVAAIPAPAHASTATDADTAMSAFVTAFWNPSTQYFYTNSDHVIHAEHAHGPEGGLYTDFWWEAQMWETVMDAYERTGSPTYLAMIDDVYDGFVAYYPGFTNNFNDDQGWWALACARAYELTSDSRYLTCAENLFATIWAEQDSTYGGGIWWRKTPHDQKNVASNATAALTAARLYGLTANPVYLTRAQNLFSWVDTTLHASDGHVYDHVEGATPGTVVKWDFTYNFGTYVGAATELYEATADSSYLTRAITAADWSVANLTAGGTFLYEGVNDAAGFKTILIRSLMNLVNDHGQSQYLPMLPANVTQTWANRRTSDNLVGPNWSASTPAGYLQSMTAAAAVSALQLVTPNSYSGTQPHTGVFDAENARSTAISAESTQAGFLGRGYLAGWNANGQSVTFDVVAASAGTHELRLRYAAAAGTATRRVLVNGTEVAANLSFPGTGSWSTWSEAVLSTSLAAGYNSVTVEFLSSAGSSTYLNLDRLTVSRQFEAEAGTLHSITTESTNAGYTGSGYLAGWNAPGQWVDLTVTATRAGAYDLTLRYAAGAGAASRYIYFNGAQVVANQAFPGTGSWTAWQTVVIPAVQLASGANTLSVIFDSAKGSTNYLNLDHATLRYTIGS